MTEKLDGKTAVITGRQKEKRDAANWGRADSQQELPVS